MWKRVQLFEMRYTFLQRKVSVGDSFYLDRTRTRCQLSTFPKYNNSHSKKYVVMDMHICTWHADRQRKLRHTTYSYRVFFCTIFLRHANLDYKKKLFWWRSMSGKFKWLQKRRNEDMFLLSHPKFCVEAGKWEKVFCYIYKYVYSFTRVCKLSWKKVVLADLLKLLRLSGEWCNIFLTVKYLKAKPLLFLSDIH